MSLVFSAFIINLGLKVSIDFSRFRYPNWLSPQATILRMLFLTLNLNFLEAYLLISETSMDKGPPQPPPPSLFVNDGSFMERFKLLRGEEPKPVEKEKSISEKDSNPKPVATGKPQVTKTGFQLKPSTKTGNPTPSGGKLAFSLKQKSKLVAQPLKLGGDDEEEDNEEISEVFAVKRQKCEIRSQPDMVPPSPSDPTVKKVADKLACFVAKNGREFEDVTRDKNPGDTPFKFLFDKTCSEYKYYEHKLNEELQTVSRSSIIPPPVSIEIPKEANNDEQNGDSLAMMDFYMKKAAQEERNRPLKQSSDEMPPPPLLSKRGHHMGDYIPPEALEKFLASCNDAEAAKAFKELAERAKIQADNVGHKLLSKMGWKEGEGLGSSSSGISDPIIGGNVKQDHLGLGAHQPGEVTGEDDIYEQYKKRMMLGYRHRPNPLNNPRKAYY